MTISEMLDSLVDDDMKVSVVRREGYSIHHLADSDVGYLRKDFPWNVVLWGWKVLETEMTDKGLYLFV